MQLTYETLPPQIQQLLMQQFGARSGDDVKAVVAQLAQNPELLAATLQKLGVNIDAEGAVELQQQAQGWIDQAASEQAGEAPPRVPADGESEEPPPSEEAPDAPAEGDGDEESAGVEEDQSETQSDDAEIDEGEGSASEDASAGAGGGGNMQATRASSATAAQVQDLVSSATGPRNVASNRGGVAKQMSMDDAISEMLSKGRQEGGASPQSRNFKTPRVTMPHSKAAQASNDPRMKKMIADIYRTVANQSSGPERAYQPSGDRT